MLDLVETKEKKGSKQIDWMIFDWLRDTPIIYTSLGSNVSEPLIAITTNAK